MNRAPDDEFPAWIRFLSLECTSWCSTTETTNNLPWTPKFLASCSFLIFLKFLVSSMPVVWSGVNVKRRGIRQLLEYSEDNFRAQERSQRAQTHVASMARGSGGSLIQKQFETIQSSCVFGADEICFDGCVSQWRPCLWTSQHDAWQRHNVGQRQY